MDRNFSSFDGKDLDNKYSGFNKIVLRYSRSITNHTSSFFISLLFIQLVIALFGMFIIGTSILLIPVAVALPLCLYLIGIYARVSGIATDVMMESINNEDQEEGTDKDEAEVSTARINENEDDINLWKLARRYYEIYRHRAPEKKKLAYELRHRILDFMDFYDYAEETEYEDEADELYDRMYYDLNRTCDIIEKVDSDDRQVIDNILISAFHGLSWVFAECDDIIERMMEIYDTITADDRKVETDVLFKPVVTSSVPTITKKEEKAVKNDPEIEDLYGIRNARLFPR